MKRLWAFAILAWATAILGAPRAQAQECPSCVPDPLKYLTQASQWLTSKFSPPKQSGPKLECGKFLGTWGEMPTACSARAEEMEKYLSDCYSNASFKDPADPVLSLVRLEQMKTLFLSELGNISRIPPDFKQYDRNGKEINSFDKIWDEFTAKWKKRFHDDPAIVKADSSPLLMAEERGRLRSMIEFLEKGDAEGPSIRLRVAAEHQVNAEDSKIPMGIAPQLMRAAYMIDLHDSPRAKAMVGELYEKDYQHLTTDSDHFYEVLVSKMGYTPEVAAQVLEGKVTFDQAKAVAADHELHVEEELAARKNVLGAQFPEFLMDRGIGWSHGGPVPREQGLQAQASRLVSRALPPSKGVGSIFALSKEKEFIEVEDGKAHHLPAGSLPDVEQAASRFNATDFAEVFKKRPPSPAEVRNIETRFLNRMREARSEIDRQYRVGKSHPEWLLSGQGGMVSSIVTSSFSPGPGTAIPAIEALICSKVRHREKMDKIKGVASDAGDKLMTASIVLGLGSGLAARAIGKVALPRIAGAFVRQAAKRAAVSSAVSTGQQRAAAFVAKAGPSLFRKTLIATVAVGGATAAGAHSSYGAAERELIQGKKEFSEVENDKGYRDMATLWAVLNAGSVLPGVAATKMATASGEAMLAGKFKLAETLHRQGRTFFITDKSFEAVTLTATASEGDWGNFTWIGTQAMLNRRYKLGMTVKEKLSVVPEGRPDPRKVRPSREDLADDTYFGWLTRNLENGTASDRRRLQLLTEERAKLIVKQEKSVERKAKWQARRARLSSWSPVSRFTTVIRRGSVKDVTPPESAASATK